jgi:hypothetical protein
MKNIHKNMIHNDQDKKEIHHCPPWTQEVAYQIQLEQYYKHQIKWKFKKKCKCEIQKIKK